MPLPSPGHSGAAADVQHAALPRSSTNTVPQQTFGFHPKAGAPQTPCATAEAILQSCYEWELFNEPTPEGIKVLAGSLSSEMEQNAHDLNVQSFW